MIARERVLIALQRKPPERVPWIETISRGGGYILSSSNSLTDNMKPENVLAMRTAIQGSGAFEKRDYPKEGHDVSSRVA